MVTSLLASNQDSTSESRKFFVVSLVPVDSENQVGYEKQFFFEAVKQIMINPKIRTNNKRKVLFPNNRAKDLFVRN